MRIEGRDHRSLWPTRDRGALEAIYQTALPHRFVTRRIADLEGLVEAIRAMVAPVAPLIGASDAYGLALALRRAFGRPPISA